MEEKKWRPTSQRWVVVNVDYAVGRTETAMALVAQDVRRKIVLLKTSVAPLASPEVAEIDTLVWARKWQRIMDVEILNREVMQKEW